jgi:ribosomal protein S24E
MRTKTGTNITQGVANVYQSVAQAKLVEPEYILKRNSPPEKPKEEANA